MSRVPITFIGDVIQHFDSFTWKDGFAYRKDLKPGESNWSISEQEIRTEPANPNSPLKKVTYRVLHSICPCGCGSLCTTPVKGDGCKDGWDWNGNETLPTMTPSIQKLTPCRWHGYLTDGVFVPV